MTSQSFDNNGLRQKLRGLWFLESFIDVLGDGSVVHMMGEGATGYIQYTDDNWMTVQIMGSDRVPYDSGIMTGGSEQQLMQAAATYFAYAGRYETHDATQTVTHYLDYCLIPNWIGSSQLRYAQFSENDTRLCLTTDPMTFNGVVHKPELNWRKQSA
ncbi:lipocalin-like domain-containing protein [Pectobacterium brasiliense]|uniref:lipocalin-like domain-containing protein n=1 Tax=Pectobacterium brasiliense TaxID=180957 RepID=UPI002A7ECD6B|nr:lipocalin-like domain-containing protein [Pectobacterium brasiliense]MDY4366822.1 lipocalin-like domain-containing protein [Pectobacterium brasiliense]MDY7056577.1 lipocalin-like domain-containing protein [Pectobacterium brasiliense]